MPNYPKMYALLVRTASAALDALPETPENDEGRRIRQSALYQAEEMYISSADEAEAE